MVFLIFNLVEDCETPGSYIFRELNLKQKNKFYFHARSYYKSEFCKRKIDMKKRHLRFLISNPKLSFWWDFWSDHFGRDPTMENYQFVMM